jgi:two-component system, sensor histidine kinase and response regulator
MVDSDERNVILIVDDDPRNLQVLGSVLVKNGYKTSAAQSGAQALDYVRKKVPDLILLDVMMPEMDGFDVCKRLKADPVLNEVPVLFITALTETSDKLKAFTSGGADYITKPFIEEEVLARIQYQLENRRLISEIKSANRTLQDLDQLKNKFLGIAAHDLRNPLTSIIGFSDMFLEGDIGSLDDDQKRIVGIIASASSQMLNLVNDLLDVSVIESGNLKLQLMNGDFKSLVEERISIAKVAADKKRIELLSSLDDVPELLFDSNRMTQVIDNLISNAVKFSNEKTQIQLRLCQRDGELEFQVQDQGPGLSQEDQDRLFGEFQKLSSKPTAGEKSTGLGLAITKKIVDAHHGRISVESNEGEGATFTVSLSLSEQH